jgi:hypothetical protein
MDDRRCRTRVNFCARADVQTGDARILDLETSDLIPRVMFVLGQTPLKTGQGYTITLHLTGDDDENAPVLRLEGWPACSTPEGNDHRFYCVDGPGDLSALRNVVMLNAEDPDDVENNSGSQPSRTKTPAPR